MEPYFETENGKLYHGDCMKIMPKLKSVDLVLTDIPYGEVNRCSDRQGGLRDLNKKDADNVTFDSIKFTNICIKKTVGSIYIFCGIEQVSDIKKEIIKNNLTSRLIVWEKTNPSPMNGQHLWLSSIETCVFGRNKNSTFNEYCVSSVIRFRAGERKHHETQKPIGLFKRLILASSNENDTVLDPCAGSGTTGLACEDLNRKYILIEKSKKNCDTISKRIKQEASQLRLPGF